MNDAPALNRDDLRSIATYQRGILLCIVGYAALIAVQMYSPPAMKLLVGLAAIAIVIISTVFVFLLSTKVFGTGLGILLGVLTLIPCVGLIVLLIVNGKATGVLKKHGIRVGLVGANVSDIK